MHVILFFETALLALAFGLAFLLNIDLAGQITVTQDAVVMGIAAAVLPQLILTPAALSSRASWITELRERTAAMMRRIFGKRPGVGAALAVGYGGIAEEFLFRGTLIPVLSAFMPVWLAVLVVGAGFGLLHPVSRSYIVLAGLLGIFWGALYVWTGNLLVPMIAHALNNVIAISFYSRLSPR